MQKRLECTVTGIVQGVMYRDFVKRKAQELNLSGTVRNLPNESVHVVAEGDEDSLKRLIPKLWEGPLISRKVTHVEKVDTTWGTHTGTLPDFRILY